MLLLIEFTVEGVVKRSEEVLPFCNTFAMTFSKFVICCILEKILLERRLHDWMREAVEWMT